MIPEKPEQMETKVLKDLKGLLEMMETKVKEVIKEIPEMKEI